ncbi:uncharacterized protein LOC121379460 [Gigantopelta aegis]|uniref:uncharacterized protein LOC121379460 n=1 Tax=Gigantopelta aegis TaxID=1735272 RepID=UPI001B88B519|nr:uncharacterized protein LOC121379460 [Gigantopelta aegis]
MSKSNGSVCVTCNINRDTNYGLKLKPGEKYIYRLELGSTDSVTVTYNDTKQYGIPYNVTMNLNDDPNKTDSDVWNSNVNNIQTSGRDLTINLKPSTFGKFYGIHDFRIELGNGDDYDILEIFVYYDERPVGLHADQHQFVCIHRNSTFMAFIENGTTLLVEWMIDKQNSTLYDYRDIVKPRRLNHTGIYHDIANINMTVIATNEIGGISTSFILHVLHPIQGIAFNANNTELEPGEVLTLSRMLSDNLPEPMGMVNVTIDYSDGHPPVTIGLINKKTTGDEFRSQKYQRQGDFNISVIMSSQVDTVEKNISIQVWHKLNISLKVNRTTWAVGDKVVFELTNIPDYGFNYIIQYGDGRQTHQSDEQVLYSQNKLKILTHVYEKKGEYTLQGRMFNKLHDSNNSAHVIIEYPVPEMTLLPNNATYPVPDGKVLFSLNVPKNIPVPENGQCLFEFEKDKAVKMVLNVTYERPLVYEYTFSRKGTYKVNVTCNNTVSKNVWKSEVTLAPFRVDELKPSLFGPLAVGDTEESTTVNFSLNFGNMVRPPHNASVFWNFNDTTTVQEEDLTNWTKSHTFEDKGIYNVKVTVSYSGITKVIEFPVRIGIVLLFVNQTAGRVDQDSFKFTADVPPGSNLRLLLSFGDSEDQGVRSNESVLHMYEKANIYHPRLTGENETFSETMVLKTPLVVDYSIDTMEISMEGNITHPPGMLKVRLSVPKGGHAIRNLSCQLLFGDAIDRQTYKWTVDLGRGAHVNYPYSYKSLGNHGVTVNCFNLISTKRVQRNVTVTNGCFDDEGMFDRQHSFSDSPLAVYSHSRIVVRGRVAVICYDRDPVYQWTVRKSSSSHWEDISLTDPPSSEVFEFKKSLLSAGLYQLSLNISFRQLRDNWLAETTYVQLIDAPLVANIDGGKIRVTPSEDVLIDAVSRSYDPKLGLGKSDRLFFNWTCGWCPSTSIQELERCQDNLSHVACDEISKPVKNGAILFLGSKVRRFRGYMFEVRVTFGGRSSLPAKQLIQIKLGAPLLKITCVINCEMKTAVSSDLSVESECLSCVGQERFQARYSWTLTRKNSKEKQIIVPHFQQNIINTGDNQSAIVIKKDFLEPGQEYSLNLWMNLPGSKSSGFASLAIVTNIPPRGGNCSVQPTTGYAYQTGFVISCFGWQDEGYRANTSDTRDGKEPKGFTYILAKDDFQLVLRTGVESTSPRLLLPIQPKLTSTYQLIVRILDILNDYTDYSMNVTVLSPIEHLNKTEEDYEYDPEEEAITFASVKKIIDAANQTMAEAMASTNLLKNMNVFTSLASVLNDVKVPNETTLVSTKLKTYTTSTQWIKLWKDYQTPRDGKVTTMIATKTEEMTSIVSSRLTEIDQFDEDQLSTLSEGMAVILQQTTKTTLVSAQISSTVVNRASKVLNKLSRKKPYPMKEKIVTAIKGTVSFINKILKKALPDPNKSLPSDVHEDIVPEPDGTSDTHKEENMFLIKKTAQANLVKRFQQINKAQTSPKTAPYLPPKMFLKFSKDIMRNIEQALPNVLDTMSSLQVKGEGPLVIERGEITMITEKKDMEMGLEFPILVSPYFTMHVHEAIFVDTGTLRDNDFSDTNESEGESDVVSDEHKTDDDDAVGVEKTTEKKKKKIQYVKLQAIEFKKNPYIYGTDAETHDVTSPVLKLTLKDAGDNPIPIDFALKMRIAKSTTSLETYNTRDGVTGPSGFLYHHFRLRNQHDVTSIFIRMKQTTVNVTCFLRAKRPPTLKKFDTKATAEAEDVDGKPGFRVFIPPKTLQAGLNYLGIQMSSDQTTHSDVKQRRRRSVDDKLANMTQNGVGDSNVVEYEMTLHTEGCRVWDEKKQKWDKEFCTVSKFTTIAETFCICGPNAPGNSFATSFYVPPNAIDFNLVFTKFDISNAAVYGLLIAVGAVYVLWVLWARKQDKKDKERWKIGYLKDNLVMDKYFYLISIYTGLRKNSGTRSNISFVLSGDFGDTGVRQLTDGKRTINTGSVMNFIMSVSAPLGDLSYLRIWHDNAGEGTSASWFLNKLVVEDLQQQLRYIFTCDRWLSVDKDDGLLDVVLPVVVKDEFMTFDKLFSEHARLNITDTHLWLSVFMRPERCTFSRVQRVSSCLALLMLVMITSAMFYKTEAEKEDEETIRHEVKIGILRFSMTEFFISTVSLLLTMPPMVLLVMLFKSCKPKRKALLRRTGSNQSPDSLAKSIMSDDVEDDVLQRRYHNKPLPHFCIYVAWFLLATIVLTCSFFLVLYSMQWGKATSEAWLTSFVVCFIESIVVIDPLKVVLVALMLTFCLRDPFFTKGDVDMNRVETEAEKFGLIKTDELKNLPEPLPPSVLAKARRRRRKEMKAQSVFFELIQYVVFLFALYSLSFGNRDDRSYMIHANIEHNLFKQGLNIEYPFELIQSHADFLTWANETFIPRMFPEKDTRGWRLPWTTRLFFSDFTSFRVGPARIRQVRMPRRQSPFYGNKYKSLVSDITYYGTYSIFGEESGNYCLGWQNEPCPLSEEAAHFTSPAWRYTQSSDVWGIPVPGQYRVYSGGGYILELNVNYDVSMEMVNELYSMLWLDRQTRAVFVEFTLYNPFVNIMAHCRFTAEFPEIGSTIVWKDIMTFRLAQHLGPIGAYVLLCEVVIGIIMVMFTVNIVKKLYDQKLSYFTHIWQTLDFITVIWCLVAIVFYIIREVNAAETLKRFRENPKRFINFQHIAIWDSLFVYTLGALVFFTTIRVLRILGYNRRVTVIAAVLSYSGRELFGFSAVFSIVFFAYVLSGYILFSAYYYSYHTIYDSMFTIFTYMLGKNIMGRLMLVAPIWAQLYCLTLVFFIIFVLLTMFQAIMNNSMTVVRDNIKKVQSPYGLIDVLVNIYRGLIRDWLPESLFKVPDDGRKEKLGARQLQQLKKYDPDRSQHVKSILDPNQLVVLEKNFLEKELEKDDKEELNVTSLSNSVC